MTTIRRARLSFGVIAIVAIILLSIAIAFLLNALLPDSGHARNVASIIQSFVTTIAILRLRLLRSDQVARVQDVQTPPDY